MPTLSLMFSVQFRSVAQLCPTFCDPMGCSMPGFPVHQKLQELTQTHVHRVSDAIQPSHPLSSFLLLPSIFPSIRVFYNESILHIMWSKYWSLNIQGWFPLGLTGLISLQSKGLSRVFSNIKVGKHQFFSAQPSLWSNSHIYMWLLEKP